jgi:hypothetical protein
VSASTDRALRFDAGEAGDEQISTLSALIDNLLSNNRDLIEEVRADEQSQDEYNELKRESEVLLLLLERLGAIK